MMLSRSSLRLFYRAGLSLFLCLSLSGCVTARFWEGRRRGMDDFAIFAHLNPQLPLHYVGGVRPEVKKVDIVGWNVPSQIAVDMTGLLQSVGKKVSTLKMETYLIEKAIRTGDTPRARQMGQIYAPLKAYLLETAASQGVRYVWFIKPIRDADFRGSPGMSLICKRGGSKVSPWEVYLQLSAELIDVATGQAVLRASLRDDDLYSKGTVDCRGSESMDPVRIANQFQLEFQELARRAARDILNETDFL